jgi:hypothetical protein
MVVSAPCSSETKHVTADRAAAASPRSGSIRLEPLSALSGRSAQVYPTGPLIVSTSDAFAPALPAVEDYAGCPPAEHGGAVCTSVRPRVPVRCLPRWSGRRGLTSRHGLPLTDVAGRGSSAAEEHRSEGGACGQSTVIRVGRHSSTAVCRGTCGGDSAARWCCAHTGAGVWGTRGLDRTWENPASRSAAAICARLAAALASVAPAAWWANGARVQGPPHSLGRPQVPPSRGETTRGQAAVNARHPAH